MLGLTDDTHAQYFAYFCDRVEAGASVGPKTPRRFRRKSSAPGGKRLAPTRAAWWPANTVSGCSRVAGRGVEIHGEKKYDYEPTKVGDVNLEASSILLIDTKNRSNHLLLSRRALAIARDVCEGREPD